LSLLKGVTKVVSYLFIYPLGGRSKRGKINKPVDRLLAAFWLGGYTPFPAVLSTLVGIISGIAQILRLDWGTRIGLPGKYWGLIAPYVPGRP
jgi:hypothetical protein